MSRPTKSLNPILRMGVYKDISEVPEKHRFINFVEEYQHMDIWGSFCQKYEYSKGNYDQFEQIINKIGNCWQDFMNSRQHHYAFATPDDIEAWCVELRQAREMSTRQIHDHWLRLYRFYDWLLWHVDYPHTYNPSLMAAANGGVVGDVWECKVERTREARERYRNKNNE